MQNLINNNLKIKLFALMKKNIQLNGFVIFKSVLFAYLVSFAAFTQAQTQPVVSTSPQNKNFLIERGSGIACCSCPSITDKCMAVVNSYPPGKGIFMVYHFGPDARPQSGQLNKDYKTKFGDSIMTPTWPFYLNMMVNRRDRGVPYGSTFVFGTEDQVTPECASVVTQTAPVNLAMSSSYNPTTREITVIAKAYYTSNSVTALNYLQIAITEDSIIGPQCVGSNWNYSYMHMDMFRANMNGFSGDSITTTTLGTMVTRTYKYIVPAKYGTEANTSSWVTPDVSHFNLTMFMTEDLNGENDLFGKIQNVIRVPLGSSSPTGIDVIAEQNEINIYPNPTSGLLSLTTSTSKNYSFEVLDLMGKVVYESKSINTASSTVDLSNLKKGLYNIRVVSKKGVEIHKVLLTN
jgi:hypothetical protein